MLKHLLLLMMASSAFASCVSTTGETGAAKDQRDYQCGSVGYAAGCRDATAQTDQAKRNCCDGASPTLPGSNTRVFGCAWLNGGNARSNAGRDATRARLESSDSSIASGTAAKNQAKATANEKAAIGEQNKADQILRGEWKIQCSTKGAACPSFEEYKRQQSAASTSDSSESSVATDTRLKCRNQMTNGCGSDYTYNSARANHVCANQEGRRCTKEECCTPNQKCSESRFTSDAACRAFTCSHSVLKASVARDDFTCSRTAANQGCGNTECCEKTDAVNCVLGDAVPTGTCVATLYCGKGSQTTTKPIVTPAVGCGTPCGNTAGPAKVCYKPCPKCSGGRSVGQGYVKLHKLEWSGWRGFGRGITTTIRGVKGTYWYYRYSRVKKYRCTITKTGVAYGTNNVAYGTYVYAQKCKYKRRFGYYHRRYRRWFYYYRYYTYPCRYVYNIAV